jgi:hypothetical protein
MAAVLVIAISPAFELAYAAREGSTRTSPPELTDRLAAGGELAADAPPTESRA